MKSVSTKQCNGPGADSKNTNHYMHFDSEDQSGMLMTAAKYIKHVKVKVLKGYVKATSKIIYRSNDILIIPLTQIKKNNRNQTLWKCIRGFQGLINEVEESIALIASSKNHWSWTGCIVTNTISQSMGTRAPQFRPNITAEFKCSNKQSSFKVKTLGHGNFKIFTWSNCFIGSKFALF